MTHADRFHFLKLDSLEERRLRFDVMFTYSILFGLVNINCSDKFAFNVLTAVLILLCAMPNKYSKLSV